MYRFLFFFLAIFLNLNHSWGQLLPANQPEQDACNALMLCGTTFHTPYSYQGVGHTSDLTGTTCDIPGLLANEDNSMWLRLEISTPGRLVFKITPVDIQDDYDWAVLNITGGNCDNLNGSQVVRCNFNNNVPVANNGVTGLDTFSNATSVAAGTTGQPMCRYIDADAGDVYLVMINNFGHNGQPSSGFTIDFDGSTAEFFNSDIPHMQEIQNPCNISNSVTFQTNKPILCSSIAANGSDFILANGGTILSAQGINCSGAQGYTSIIKVTFANVLPPGNYTLKARMGTDNNTLLDLCNNALPLPDSLNFVVPILATTEDIEICKAQLPYHWNGQTIPNGGQAVAQATFPTSLGCDSVVTLNLSVVDTLEETEHITVCPDQMPFQWNGMTISQEGTHVASFFTQSADGCDSLTYLDLTVQHPVNQTFNLEGCWQVSFNNKNYDHDQTALDTVISSFGCDSIYATLNIVVHQPDTITRILDTAGCDQVVFKGNVYTSSTTLLDTIKNQFGCDSIYNITHITVYPNQYVTHTNYITDCETVIFEGKAYKNDITLRDTFQNVLGCDSAIRITQIHPEHFKLAVTADPLNPVVGDFIRLETSSNLANYHIVSWKPHTLFPNQTAEYQVIPAPYKGDYQFIITGVSENNCQDTATINIHVDPLIPQAYMPNAFTPNGDGLNDIFKPNFPSKSGYTIETFNIYNRYGQPVYRAYNQKDAGWNGKMGNTGELQPMGTYFYQIKINFVDGSNLELKGDVNLIR